MYKCSLYFRDEKDNIQEVKWSTMVTQLGNGMEEWIGNKSRNLETSLESVETSQPRHGEEQNGSNGNTTGRHETCLGYYWGRITRIWWLIEYRWGCGVGGSLG